MPTLPSVQSVNWYLYPAMSGVMEYDGDGNLVYEGINQTSGVSETDANWFITKYYYVNNQLVYWTVLQGLWRDRVALFAEYITDPILPV